MCLWSLAGARAQAAGASISSACARPGADAAHQSRGGASFAWTTQAAAQDSPAAFSMAVWGDSLTSASHFIDPVLQAYGIGKNDARPSFIQAAMKVPGLHLPLKAHCASKGWKLAYAYKEKNGAAGFSRGLVSMRSDTPGDTLFLDFRSPSAATRLKGVTVLYDKHRPDSSLVLAVSVDGGQEDYISLRESTGTSLHIKPDAPMSTLKLRLVSGQVTLHGFEPRYHDAPGAIVDALSLPGATLRGWSNAGERYFPKGQGPDYRLILVQYGTNEGAGRFQRAEYLAYLRNNLARLRSFYPQARCILVGPPDRGVVGSVGPPASLKYAAIHAQIALAQRQVGSEYRCEFWDWQAAMGGPGAAARWAGMQPPLMQRDLTHLSAKGYEASGRMFAKAFPLKQQ